MASSSPFLTWIDHRLRKKEQIEAYILATASNTPDAIDRQWRQLQAEVERIASAEKEIADLIERQVVGDAELRAAWQRAEGSVQAQRIAAQARVFETQRSAESADLKTRTEAENRIYDQIQSRITSAQNRGVEERFTAARSLASSLDPDAVDVNRFRDSLNASLTSGLRGDLASTRGDAVAASAIIEQFATPILEKIDGTTDPVKRATLRSTLADALAQGAQQAGVSLSPAAVFAGPRALAAAEYQTQVGQLTGATTGTTPPPRIGGAVRPPTEAERLGVPEGQAEVARQRAAYNKLNIERPDDAKRFPTFESFVASTDPVAREAITEFQQAPLAAVFAYADPNIVSRLRSVGQAKSAVDAEAARLRDLQRNPATYQDIARSADVAFTELYGSPKARAELDALRQATGRAAAVTSQPLTGVERAAALTTSPSSQIDLSQVTNPVDRLAIMESMRQEQALREDVRGRPFQTPAAEVEPIATQSFDAMRQQGLLSGQPLNTEDYTTRRKDIPGAVRPDEGSLGLMDAPVKVEEVKAEEVDIDPLTGMARLPSLSQQIEEYESMQESDEWSEDPVLGEEYGEPDNTDIKQYDTIPPERQQKIDNAAEAAVKRLTFLRQRVKLDEEPDPKIVSEMRRIATRLKQLVASAGGEVKGPAPKPTAEKVDANRGIDAAIAGRQEASEIVTTGGKIDPAQALKKQFGSNKLHPKTIKAVQDLARRPINTLADVEAQLAAIDKKAWVNADDSYVRRRQMKSLFSMFRELNRAQAV